MGPRSRTLVDAARRRRFMTASDRGVPRARRHHDSRVYSGEFARRQSSAVLRDSHVAVDARNHQTPQRTRLRAMRERGCDERAGAVSVKQARDEGLAASIAEATGLSVAVVEDRLAGVHGRTLVQRCIAGDDGRRRWTTRRDGLVTSRRKTSSEPVGRSRLLQVTPMRSTTRGIAMKQRKQ